MPTAENAIVYYEAGQEYQAMAALTDSGDRKKFEADADLWSDRSGYSPVVRPNGLATGGLVTPPASGSNDVVDIAALTAYLGGELKSVDASSDESVTRATTDTHIINSITITAAGAIAVVAGSEGTAFSETRGAAGGPPWIDNDAVEIAQVRLSAQAAAPVTADEILQVVGVHCERYDYPTWEVKFCRVENLILGNAGVLFNSALAGIHSEDAGTTVAGKQVFAEYYEPIFAELPNAQDFVPPAESHSVSSQQVYGGTIASSSKSLGQGSFTAFFKDGVTDALLSSEGAKLWFKFKPDRLKSAYILCQGILGVSLSFPAGDNISGACTISPESKKEGVSG